jgi:hypothetical protein
MRASVHAPYELKSARGVSDICKWVSGQGELGVPTPMKQSYRWLDSQSHHACNHIIVMCHTLLVHRPISKREKSRP